MKRPKFLLILAGICAFATAVFQIVVGFVPELSVYFGAPPDLLANPNLLIVASLGMGAVFALAGLYGLSGADLFPRLPLMRLALIVITVAALYRGIPFFFQLPILLKIVKPEVPLPLQAWVSALFALVVALLYLFGLIFNWIDLGYKK